MGEIMKFLKSYLVSATAFVCFASPLTAFANDSFDLDPFEAQSYAHTYNVSEKEAARRLRLMAHVPEIADAITEKLGDDVGGVYFDHSGNKLTMVVRTTRDYVSGPKHVKFNDRFHTPDDKAGKGKKGKKGNNDSRVLVLNVRYETGATLNRTTIEDIVDNRTSRLLTLVPGLQGFGYDPRTNKLFLNIHGVEEAEVFNILNQEGLLDIDGLEIEFRMMENPIEAGAVRGGAGITGCTTGFVGTDLNGNDGVLTALHCSTFFTPNRTNFTYTGNDGASHTLVASPLNRSANHDIMFLTGSTTFPAEFFPDSSSIIRSVTGTRLRTSTNTNGWFSSGSNICHNGQTTGKSCGEVDSIKYRPTHSLGCGTAVCNAVFVTVKGPNLACAGGDSGGPWYATNTAFGIHSAGSSRGVLPGQCDLAIYSSVDYASELGVSIKF